MTSGLVKGQLNLHNVKRKVLLLAVCSVVIFCIILRETSYVNCCFKDISMVYNSDLFDVKGSVNSLPECRKRKPDNINCVKLSMGDKSELHKVSRHIKHTKTGNKCQLVNLAENCNALKTAHNYVTDMKTILAEEVQFPLAFTIKMHRNPAQAEQLLRTIYRPHNMYCIYIDKKTNNEVYDVMRKVAKCFKNIFVVEKRINVVYSSINLVEAELECMRTLTKTNSTWKYYINLTGQEFPLKTNFEIVKILQKLNGANDIESYDFPFMMQNRYTKQHIIQDNAIIKTNQLKQSFVKRFQMSKGSAYGTFSKPFVDFILTDNIAIQFLNWLNGSYAPEESAWATLNSLPWAPGAFPREIRHSSHSFLSRAIIWSWDGIKCQGHYVRGICVYESGDLPWLVNRVELFANKFDEDRDHVVIDCLEEILKNRTFGNKYENLNWHFYNTLPHAEYYAKVGSAQQSTKYLHEQKEAWLKEHNVTF